MEKLSEKYLLAKRALQQFKEDLDLLDSNSNVVQEYYKQFRSSAIQSFEFSLDTLWKFAKLYLIEKFNIIFDAPSPRSVFRQCWQVNIMSEDEFNRISKIVADRNLTSHSYNEEIAEEITQQLSNHYELMKKTFDRFEVAS